MTTHNSRPLTEAAGAKLNLETLSLAPHRNNDPMPGCLTAALDHAAVGVHVFPLSAGKKPLALCANCAPPSDCPGRDECRCGVSTCHGFYAATTDSATLLKWWGQNPAWQLGIRTGSCSGLVALDVDVDKGGLDSLMALQAQGFDIRGAAMQLSGSGRSFHLMYAHPGRHVPNSQGKLGPGLDVRGDGGYVVGAPSLHAKTRAPYVLLGQLDGLPTWPMPPEVQNERRSRPGTSVSAILQPTGGPMTPARVAALVVQVREAAEGQRRSTLFWAACRLGGAGGQQAALLAAGTLLLQAAEEAGLTAAEAYATLRDGVLAGRSS